MYYVKGKATSYGLGEGLRAAGVRESENPQTIGISV